MICTPRAGARVMALYVLLFCCASFASPLIIGVPSDVLRDFEQAFPAPVDYSSPPNYQHPNNRRDVAELMLLHRALWLGGFRGEFLHREVDGYLRILQQLSEGQLDVTGTSIWDFDGRTLAESVLLTRPLVRRGEFRVGIYTREQHPALQNVKSLEQLIGLSVVTNRNWKMDWSLLEQMGFTNIQYANSWESMVKMVLAGRADILLAPFPDREDLNIELGGGGRLAPIPGLAVSFPGERLLLVSKKHPKARELLTSIQNGLKQLEVSGELHSAYEGAGFFNRKTKDWQVLKP